MKPLYNKLDQLINYFNNEAEKNLDKESIQSQIYERNICDSIADSINSYDIYS